MQKEDDEQKSTSTFLRWSSFADLLNFGYFLFRKCLLDNTKHHSDFLRKQTTGNLCPMFKTVWDRLPRLTKLLFVLFLIMGIISLITALTWNGALMVPLGSVAPLQTFHKEAPTWIPISLWSYPLIPEGKSKLFKLWTIEELSYICRPSAPHQELMNHFQFRP